MKLSPKYLNMNSNIYDIYFKIGMEDGWYKGNKEENYEIMLKVAKYAKSTFYLSTCLDVGCGTGDLAKHLFKLKIAKYTGIDIYLPSLLKAINKYPKANFFFTDIFSGEIKEEFDYVFCSGALTMKIEDNYLFIEEMIKTMWKLTKKGLVFNFLTSEDNSGHDPDLFCYDPQKVEQICKRIDEKAVLVSEKTPNKAQVHIFMLR